MSLAPGTRLGAYEVLSLLGTGGMGEVYRARDTRLSRDVAIKVLPDAFVHDADRLARFKREAHVLASLNHPHIAGIYGLEETPQGSALVLELVDGPTLADRIARGPIPLDEALPIARQIAEALEAAHEHGIIHRDLKPANIKLTADDKVKVLDFGLAKAAGPDSSARLRADLSVSPTITSPAMSMAGVILGTAAYMSPEQARGKIVDKRSDIWAFGCVLFEMLTGKSAFIGEDVSLTLSKILQRDVDWAALPPGTPAAIAPLLRRCLEKDPTRRLRDIGEARIALESDLQNRPAVADAEPARRAGRRLIQMSVAVVAVATIAVAAGIFGWMLRDAPSAATTAVVRVAVTLPPSQPISGLLTWLPLAMAPDGSRLAYVSNGKLFLRRMDSLEIEPTLGTDGAWAPFFSPDSQWVGFYAQGQLKKVSVAGGVAVRICDAPVPAGATWGPDGFIYFAPSNMSGLSKVSAEGGTPSPFTTLDRANGEVSHRSPQALPDGTAVLFTVWRGPGFDEMDLHAQIPASGERRRILSGANTGRFVQSGHIVYTHGGELNAIRFDPRRLETGGDRIPLGISVLDGEGSYYDVSRGGILIYVPGTTQWERQLMSSTHDGKMQPLAFPPRAYEDVVVSPDGSKLAVTVAGATWGIWIGDLSRGTLTPATGGPESSQWPVWTPDGKRIIYRGTRKGSRNIYWKPADGGGTEERLTTSPHLQTPSSVSPDGRWLAFEEIHPQTGRDISLLSLDEKRSLQSVVSTAADEHDPKFSHDGRWIAYTSDESARSEVYVQLFPASGGRSLVSNGGGVAPVWSRNGRTLHYLSGDTVMSSEFVTTPSIRFGIPRQLAISGIYATLTATYDVSADDTRFFWIRRARESHTELHVVVNWFDELRRKVPHN